MLPPILRTIDLADLADAAGATSYARGVKYAQQNAVARMRWDEGTHVLFGSVHGSGGNLYHTTAFFSALHAGRARFLHGECDCPVGFDCKHVVALVRTAVATAESGATLARQRPRTWEDSLGALLTSRSANAPETDRKPLAIELTLSESGSAHRQAITVLARLVTQGRNG